jgi:hypothetical protein
VAARTCRDQTDREREYALTLAEVVVRHAEFLGGRDGYIDPMTVATAAVHEPALRERLRALPVSGITDALRQIRSYVRALDKPASLPPDRTRACAAPDCEVVFQPRRAAGRYCSASCRQRAHRRGRRLEQ